MQTASITLNATTRTLCGGASSRRMRRDGILPANVYGEHGARAVQVKTKDFETMLRHSASDNLLINLVVDDGQPVKVLLRELQHHPVDNALLHGDFLEISMTRKMRVTIRIAFVGEPVGVTIEGGILQHSLRSFEVECLPGDIVDSFPVDVSQLHKNESLLVRDVKFDSKYKVLTSPELAVATVTEMVAEVVEAAPVTVEGAAAGPEVIGKKKEGAEEAAASEGGKDKEAAGGKAEAGKDKAAPKEHKAKKA
ncbi:MAG: 50S ribosomal protein L25 [bacterium]